MTATGGTMRTLVAGVGNVFCGDDGFGVAVAEQLARQPVPDGVEVRDYGIRGVHLAYQLLEPYGLVVLVDAVQRGEEPGTLYVIEHEGGAAPAAGGEVLMDAHDMTPDAILALVPTLGGTLGRVVVVGCEPSDVGPGMQLSDPVAAAVPEAVRLVGELIGAAPAAGTPTGGVASGARP